MGPTATPTQAERRRWRAMEELGCLISRVYREKPHTPGEFHHIVEGGRRLGHQQTLYLHPWYHRGVPPSIWRGAALVQLTVSEAKARFGPSLELHPREFEERFGTQRELLEMQDRLVAHWIECAREATV